MTIYTHRNGETAYPSVPGTYWTEHPISGEFRTRSISHGDIDFDNMLPIQKRAGNYYAFYGPIPLPSASAQPIPIPDNPDDDPLGLHAQRWVRVDRITLVCLKAVLRGDASAPLRPFVEMLARRMEEALSTPQEQDVVAMPQVDEITPIITRWTELMLALVEDLKDSQQPEGADALRDEARTVTRWLTLQRRPGKGE